MYYRILVEYFFILAHCLTDNIYLPVFKNIYILIILLLFLFIYIQSCIFFYFCELIIRFVLPHWK